MQRAIDGATEWEEVATPSAGCATRREPSDPAEASDRRDATRDRPRLATAPDGTSGAADEADDPEAAAGVAGVDAGLAGEGGRAASCAAVGRPTQLRLTIRRSALGNGSSCFPGTSSRY